MLCAESGVLGGDASSGSPLTPLWAGPRSALRSSHPRHRAGFFSLLFINCDIHGTFTLLDVVE